MKNLIDTLRFTFQQQCAEVPEIEFPQQEYSSSSVIDETTTATIEVGLLFRTINSAETLVGQAQLHRSLFSPSATASTIRDKQAALYEIASNPDLKSALVGLVERSKEGEKALFFLLFSKFIGLVADTKNALEYSGFGYKPYRYVRNTFLDLVRLIDDIPEVDSVYLKNIRDKFDFFAASRSVRLVRDGVYIRNHGIQSRDEKPWYVPGIRLTPRLFKPFLIGLIAAALIVLKIGLDLGIQVQVTLLTLFMYSLVPIFFAYLGVVGGLDRDNGIYPFRAYVRESDELRELLTAIGQLDELLTFQRFADSFGSPVVLPEITDAARHQIVLSKVKSPILAFRSPEYVANDVCLKDCFLSFISGPNSGGKTALSKTITQVQLLAQAGCYIPAEQATMSVADKINYQAQSVSTLESGEGRFGTELKRTRDVFFTSSSRSLVVLDELAEGTSTQEKLRTSITVLDGFCKLGNNTILITHNRELIEYYRDKNTGQYLQAEFTDIGPSFHFIEGIAASSHAELIANRIGFGKDDIDNHLAAQDDS